MILKTVIIIPTYNEKGNIGRLIEVLEKVIKGLPEKFVTHILVVDDSSPDGTGEEVRIAKKRYPNVHLLTNPRKIGLGSAYLKGMDHAVDVMKADILMEFDADFSHDPLKIPQFLDAIDQGSDLVLGSRYIKGGTIPANWGWHRKFFSIGGNLFIRVVMTHFAIHDWTTGYRAIRKEVYKAIKATLNRERFFGYTFQIAFLFQALRKGFIISEVPIHFIDRTRGTSKLGPEYIKNNLIFIIKTRLGEIMRNRIFKFAFVGGMGALIQLVTANLYAGYLQQSLKIASLVLSLPDILAIETAVASNFILNNMWTFSDKKLKVKDYLPKFLQFNLASFGSIGIQTIVIGLGLGLFGVKTLFTLPLVALAINSRTAYHVTGIIIGMFWNFFAYTKFIWKTK